MSFNLGSKYIFQVKSMLITKQIHLNENLLESGKNNYQVFFVRKQVSHSQGRISSSFRFVQFGFLIKPNF